MRKQITVNTKCGADFYAPADTKIVEFSNKNGTGGLVSFRNNEDGSITVELYRLDATVKVKVSEHSLLTNN
jgi:hypothetical protein